ncbi:Na(+)/H(+) antiporter subunit D [Egicoccus sp. AB-alg6-2]|uniref:Na(+)/H(+) antiporter subunit D n=1 Tax=Egicoccus sp. AB-alg6-2 TaxID=3242692 RepID=UPI00359DCB65
MADNPLLLHPALPLLLAAVVVRFVPRVVGQVLLIVAPLLSLAALAGLELGTSVEAGWFAWQLELLRVDGLARPFGVIFGIAAVIAGIYGLPTMSRGERSSALAYAGAAMGVVFAGDLITFFVFWEIKAIASTFVVLARRAPLAGRAGMRYLYMHVLGGKLLLAGIVWHYTATGSLTFSGFDVSTGGVLILLACLISAAVPPLHAWLPDAYPEATIAGTVFLSAYTTKAAVYALARGFAGWEVLVWLGIFMALYGVVYAVLENDIRRLLGYHIISQVGYMVAGVGIGTQLAINGATAHAFAHILYKGLLLMGAGAVIYATGRSKMSALGGIANRMRTVLVLYLVGAASISSVPFFSGFVAKELVVEGAYVDERIWLVILLQIASVGTFLHTGLKLPYGAWFGHDGVGPRTNEEGHHIHVGAVPRAMIAAMGLSAVLNFGIGLFPNLLYDLLPFPVDYQAYSVGKVLEKSQILVFTALAFFLLLGQLHAKAMVTVDTDWLYRRLPLLVRDTASRARHRRDPVDRPAPAEPAVRGPLVRARTAVLARTAQREPGGPPPVAATWTLGSVLLAAAVLVLVVSVVR